MEPGIAERGVRSQKSGTKYQTMGITRIRKQTEVKPKAKGLDAQSGMPGQRPEGLLGQKLLRDWRPVRCATRFRYWRSFLKSGSGPISGEGLGSASPGLGLVRLVNQVAGHKPYA